MYLKTILLGAFFMCSIPSGQFSMAGQLPVVMEPGKSVRIDIPKSESLQSKPLLKIQVQIQNAIAGTEIAIEDASTGELAGVISPFGKTGRNATESFLVPLGSKMSTGELQFNFRMNQPIGAAGQKITIESVTLMDTQ